jgi:hypothetical protein
MNDGGVSRMSCSDKQMMRLQMVRVGCRLER